MYFIYFILEIENWENVQVNLNNTEEEKVRE